jgi:hypothetical protein
MVRLPSGLLGRGAALVGLLLFVTLLRAAGLPHQWGEWPDWGDRGDGTYRNPVLPSDYSDLDCILVRAEYYAISSTFQFSPGMVVLHSRDLVVGTKRMGTSWAALPCDGCGTRSNA